MPLVSKAFGDIITFTRASTATYFDATGTLQSAAVDAPRFDYDPSTLAARGFLIEEARTNLLTYSEQFDNAAWTKTALNTTGTPPWVDVAVAPSGATTADKLIEDTSTGTHGCNQNITPVSGTTYAISFYAKAGERTIVRAATGSSLGTKIAFVDLSSGIITSESGTGTASVTSIGNGWYRIALVVTATSTSTDGLFVRLVSTGTTFSYTGDGTSGLYIWGAQLEAGAFPTSYIPTTTTALTRSADAASVNTLSPWYNAAEGTLYVQFFNAGDVLAQRFAAINDGTGSNSIEMISSGTGVGPYGFIQSGGSGQTPGPSPTSPITANTLYKTAIAYATNNAAGFVNGTQNVIDTASVVVPTGLTKLQIGSQTSLTNWSNAWIQRVTYYPRRLSQAEGEALTA